MNFRLQVQLDEAFGPLNRWYCSQAHGREVDDPECLLVYFIRSGGAKNFADRFEEAMGAMNKWYCSEFYGRDIREEETLWNYYLEHRADWEAAKLHGSGCCRSDSAVL